MNIEDIQTIAVIGAGQIGQAAALEFALGGYDVRLHSRSPESLERRITSYNVCYTKLLRDGAPPALNRPASRPVQGA